METKKQQELKCYVTTNEYVNIHLNRKVRKYFYSILPMNIPVIQSERPDFIINGEEYSYAMEHFMIDFCYDGPQNNQSQSKLISRDINDIFNRHRDISNGMVKDEDVDSAVTDINDELNKLTNISNSFAVIEWNKFIENTDDYLKRYQTLFTDLRKQSKPSVEGKSENEAFEILYNLLRPLNFLNALRIRDVSKRLYPHARIGDNGVIYCYQNENILFRKFFSINQLSESELSSLAKDILNKYFCILEVFRKARIFYVEDNHGCKQFITDEVPFADRNCILFDYVNMHSFVKKTYKNLRNNYKKAFYLSRLRRYDEAFFLFSEVAKQAFNKRDYLLYYLAESNCISLNKVIKNVNTWYRCYDVESVEALSPNDSEIENLFRRLPVEFRNTYDTLTDIHSVNMLYKYSYEAFVDGQKLQKAIESESTEIGLTSSGKAICRVNDYLHFLQGNGIVADVFVEYRNAVKNLMSMLVYKYSSQAKRVLHEQFFPFAEENSVYFDEIDFHCFIEYFDAKEISALLNKYNIETIEFQNMNMVESAVYNLLDYYSYAVRYFENKVDVIGLQTQIKNGLTLLRYVNISQPLVDRICSFILKHEFREILINDKVIFLDHQLARRKMFSKATCRVVENTLISYLEKHITALEKGERFEMYSTIGNINYCNLVHYISASEERYYSRRLSRKISQIMSNNLIQMYNQIPWYYKYVSKYQRKRIVIWANRMITESFNFELLKMLVQYDERINDSVIIQLKKFLKKQIDTAKTNDKNGGVVVHPINKPYEELNQVGFWCLIDVFNVEDFREFLGNSAEFDFYCEYEEFDFRRFEVSWLLNLYPHALEKIAKSAKVKEHVRMAIANALSDNTVVASDSRKLQNILVNNFC